MSRKVKKDFEVSIRFSLLQRIAEFYQFPVAVFMGNKEMFKLKTRESYYRNKIAKIKKIIEE